MRDQGAPRPLPRQDHRRRAGDRRPRPHAASARRRHHRLGQVGVDQHHDPVAPLPVDAGRVPHDHDRPEDAGTLDLRRHPASADAGRHRSEAGGHRAEVDRARDGRPLPQDVEARRPQHRRLQRAPGAGARQGRDALPHGADRLRPGHRRGDLREGSRCPSIRCRSSSSSSTRWPT